MELIARASYLYLFALIVCTAIICFRIGFRTDVENKPLSPVLHALHLLILGLVFVQSYQVFSLIISPITATWWIPLVCKNSSLLAYIVILMFIQWRVSDSCTQTDNKCSCDKYI